VAIPLLENERGGGEIFGDGKRWGWKGRISSAHLSPIKVFGTIH